MEVIGNSIDSVTAELFGSVGVITLTAVFPALILLVICLLVIKILLKLLDRVFEKSGLEKSLCKFVRTAAKYLLLFLTLLLVAATLGINVTSLIAVFSVLGLAVSLAVQGALSNLAGGIMLLVSKPFKLGDYVEAGGVEGTINDIGLGHTKLLTVDNKIICVPNGDISASKITNYTYEEKRRVDLTFTASYDAPIDTVYKALREAVDSIDVFLKDPEPFIKVLSYQNSSIEYVVRAWTATGDYWTGYFELIEKAMSVFNKHGIEMTYDHINVHMVEK